MAFSSTDQFPDHLSAQLATGNKTMQGGWGQKRGERNKTESPLT